VLEFDFDKWARTMCMVVMCICLLCQDVTSLHQALEAYTRREILDRENSYNCERLLSFLKRLYVNWQFA